MFRGRFELAIDDKGRVNIPSRFRDTLKERYDDRLVITNYEKCLVVYPFSEWVTLEEKISAQSMESRKDRAFLRMFVSGATECSLDRQGRVLIPNILRQFAGLEKEIVLAGMIKKMEIWSRDRWHEEMRMPMESLDEMGAVLSGLGIL